MSKNNETKMEHRLTKINSQPRFGFDELGGLCWPALIILKYRQQTDKTDRLELSGVKLWVWFSTCIYFHVFPHIALYPSQILTM